ncbi:UDP-glucuronosyl and UDP-glucosyl transferase [Handroanthus impetiginosus]|uniref:Glycosyltransferase n=1 Tax=Handroanthus impetiginosus TaxID=429701 RepID=A0A2G9HWL4_9LAMI|nr:UDP-glucuronosyl and UDP-glucosyl transferase [Handroanthus impetiginosus]
MESLATNHKTLHVLMFPWLAHGHISPYVELAKRLTKRNFIIHLCSTPANLSSIKHKIGEKYALSIHLVELHLPTLPKLPPCHHTTNGLPPDLMPILKLAFEMSKPNFNRILETIRPDLLIYDFLQPWAPLAASRYGIPAVEFITSSSTMTAYMFHFFLRPNLEFPFENISYRDYELVHRANLLPLDERIKRDAFEGIHRSNNIILIKGFREIESKYSDYLSTMLGKKIVPVGPLVQDPIQEFEDPLEIIKWLDKKPKNSTVFVSFGSEYFLKQEETQELAHGLELSNINFIWVVRFPKGEKRTLEQVLPSGFLERVRDRGLVLEGWAPQAQILGHENIGGFVSHCGCSSMMESMKFGVPIIAMPMHLDQPLNARLLEEIGVGVEVVRNGLGRLDKEEVAAVIRRVVAEDGGEGVRRNAKLMSEKIKEKGDEEIDEVVEEFVKLCKKKGNGFH